LREKNTEKEKREEAHNFQKDRNFFLLSGRVFSRSDYTSKGNKLSIYIKSTLLALVLSLLIFLGFNSVQNNTSYITYTKELSKQNNPNHKLGFKVDKFIEKLTVGIYNQYSKKLLNIKELEKKAKTNQTKSLLFLYYFFGTIIIFALIFMFIDYEFLILFIGSASLISLFFGLFAPLLIIIVYKSLPIVGMVTLSFDTKSIIGTIEKLFSQHNYIIAALVLSFSIIIPFIKSMVILLYGFLKESGFGENIIVIIDKLGKWSMADVFIVALLVVFFSTRQDINSALKIESGLYFFLGYVLLSMIGSFLIGKK